ncbi:hypothetical protein BCR44DRAFT_46446 [Catenaria anguillulae PL171]|uniref:Ubiquitin-like protease family profile domain-containing protein n=1 Tax=Catenaria anguillulae PL171 TaxID=765915 RepID=A0A1Y2HM15_9FUNG|nr:hypothetical protein BCR44DRAFT_46446 [Catenaria anguillulae PL171]
MPYQPGQFSTLSIEDQSKLTAFIRAANDSNVSPNFEIGKDFTLYQWGTLLNPHAYVPAPALWSFLKYVHATLPHEVANATVIMPDNFFSVVTSQGSEAVRDWVHFALLPPKRQRVVVYLNDDSFKHNWAVACIWLKTPNSARIDVYDPMGDTDRAKCMGNRLGAWLFEERSDPAKGHLYGDHSRMLEDEVVVCGCPRSSKPDGSSSGVFAAAIVEWLLLLEGRGDMPERLFSERMVATMRSRMDS